MIVAIVTMIVIVIAGGISIETGIRGYLDGKETEMGAERGRKMGARMGLAGVVSSGSHGSFGTGMRRMGLIEGEGRRNGTGTGESGKESDLGNGQGSGIGLGKTDDEEFRIFSCIPYIFAMGWNCHQRFAMNMRTKIL